MKKVLMMLLMAVMMCGCSCEKTEVKCPSDKDENTQETNTVIKNEYTQLYEESVKSVVKVVLKNIQTKKVSFQGSGVVVFEEGDYAYVATNYHVISELSSSLEIEVYFSNEKGVQSGKSEIATVIGKDSNEDVALLRINKSDKYKVASIGNSDLTKHGDFIYTIGSPLDYFNVTTAGYITSTNVLTKYDVDKDNVSVDVYEITFNAPISAGNSGGALFNSNGELIGITTYNHTDITYFYSALPINYYMKVAKYILAEGREYTRPSLNISILSINTIGVDRTLYGIADDVYTGVYIRESRESNISAQSIIKAVNGVDVKNANDYGKELLKYSVGETITLTLTNKDGLNERIVNVVLHS